MSVHVTFAAPVTVFPVFPMVKVLPVIHLGEYPSVLPVPPFAIGNVPVTWLVRFIWLAVICCPSKLKYPCPVSVIASCRSPDCTGDSACIAWFTL